MDGGEEFKGGILGDMLPGGAIESLIYADPMHSLEGREGCLYKVLYSDPIESATVDVKMFLTHAIYARHRAYTLKTKPNMEILLVGSK